MQEIEITGKEAGQRLDKYLQKYLDEAGKSFLYKMIRKKNITLNGGKCDGSEKLNPGDKVQLYLSGETIEKFRSHEKVTWPYKPLSVLYEDDDVLLIDKPAGMLSQKAEPSDISLNEYLVGYLLHEKKITEEELSVCRPSVCNRLDRNTSGIVVCGKTLKGLQMMASVLKERSAGKYYLCLIEGVVEKPRHCRGYLYKDEAANKVTITTEPYPGMEAGEKPIETEYIPLAHGPKSTLLGVKLITGRSHQIRAHLASIGHPVIGDPKYGDEKINAIFQRKYHIHSQLLHAYRMVFPKEMKELGSLAGKEILAPVPREMREVMAGEEIHLA